MTEAARGVTSPGECPGVCSAGLGLAREAGRPGRHCGLNPGRRGQVREKCAGDSTGRSGTSALRWNALDFMTSRVEEKEREITGVT